MTARKKSYRVLRGFNYPQICGKLEGKRVEIGDIIDDLHPKALAHALRRGLVELVEPSAEDKS